MCNFNALFGLLVAGAHGQTLEVLQPTVPLSVKAGETLKLSCTLSGLDIPGGIRWYKGLDRGQPPVYSDKGAPPPPRVTRVVPGSNTNYDIRISSIVPNDAGTYYCVKFRSGSPEKEYKSGKGTVVSVIGECRPKAVGVQGGKGDLPIHILETEQMREEKIAMESLRFLSASMLLVLMQCVKLMDATEQKE